MNDAVTINGYSHSFQIYYIFQPSIVIQISFQVIYYYLLKKIIKILYSKSSN